MQSSRFFTHLVSAAALTLAASTVLARPSGHIAYTRMGTAYVTPAAGGPERRLKMTLSVSGIDLSPRDGSALYLAYPKGAEDLPPREGFVSPPPFQSARKLQALTNTSSAAWAADGRQIIATLPDTGKGLLVNPASGRSQTLPSTPDSISRDGRVAAYSTGREVRVRWITSGRERTLFTIGHPQPLFDAMKRARNQARLKELMDGMDASLWGSERNWVIGGAAIAPDGKAVFFAANAGTGQGAQGNTSFVFFRADVATGRLEVLSRAGVFFGRSPEPCRVSPDGRRLLFASSAHSSAIENPFGVWIIDLPTQAVHELLEKDPAGHDRMNLVDGACWSPDGRYVAVSVYYYRPKDLLPDFPDPDERRFRVTVFDAATGRSVRLAGYGIGPSWGR